MGCVGGWHRTLTRGKRSRCTIDVQIGRHWGPGCGDRPFGVPTRDISSTDLPVNPPGDSLPADELLLMHGYYSGTQGELDATLLKLTWAWIGSTLQGLS